ncbi:PREDICTED: syntaxin-5 isoform X1 [Rhagoletis zephyria]|uniref:syntaxin-5 isoform X1 n=1 Tax=Rhagoletis zephyria TaxID=28612 RepID=UPI0008116D33|nr:PREDICTED: syntaxin-5 isoform X1 [Rhagoletis zephyria]
MPTRRRHYQPDTTKFDAGSYVETTPLVAPQGQQQQQQQQYKNPLFGGAVAPTVSGNDSFGGSGVLESTILIGDYAQPNTNGQQYNFSNNNNSAVDPDDKYTKASRQWNLRSISTRLQASSGQAIRNFIQQPLSAAAAVVTGNHHSQDYSGYNQISPYANTPQNVEEIEEEDLFEKEEIFIMASRDRTGEFNNAIRSLQSRNITRAVNIRDPRKAKEVQSYSEFMMVAKYIGKNIASAYAKLEKLTMLAKKKSLFDDRPQEIQELTYIIKGDLNALNQQIARLQEISKDQRRTSSGKHLQLHSSNMVYALQSKLASMGTDFKQILEVRTENLKQQKARRDQFGQSPIAASTVRSSTAKQGSLLLSEENTAVSIDMAASDTTPLLGAVGGSGIQTQQQIALYDDSDSYVQQRAETMQNIESTIVELGGIFQQLAHMVKEQEETVERIDTNIQDAELNIEAAHSEILKYFQSVSKNRWLMIKIFAVLIFFFIFFVVFLT